MWYDMTGGDEVAPVRGGKSVLHVLIPVELHQRLLKLKGGKTWVQTVRECVEFYERSEKRTK